MNTVLFTVLAAAILGVCLCAPSDFETRASNCKFDPLKDQLCRDKNQKIPIPCETQCKKYYVCNDNLIPEIHECGAFTDFNATTLVCATDVDCKWYEHIVDPPTAATVPETTTQPSTGKPTGTVPTSKPTSGASSPPSSIVFLVFSTVISWVIMGYF